MSCFAFCIGKSRSFSERSESVASDPDTNAFRDEKPSVNLDENNGDSKQPDKETTEEISRDGDDEMAKNSESVVEGKSAMSAFKVEEHKSAVDFIEELAKILPYLLNLTSASEVDELLQKFSSDFSNSKSVFYLIVLLGMLF